MSTVHAEAVAPTPGRPGHADALFESLYDDLRRLARREVWRNGARDFVGTRTLVHEAWLEISRRHALAFDEPGKFLAYATQTMRGLVIDRVRAHHAQKRGGGLDITALDTHAAEQAMQPDQLDHVSEAIDALAATEPQLAQVVDLKFFCGFTLAEIARMLDVSERTVQRQWEKARLMLHDALGG